MLDFFNIIKYLQRYGLHTTPEMQSRAKHNPADRPGGSSNRFKADSILQHRNITVNFLSEPAARAFAITHQNGASNLVQ